MTAHLTATQEVDFTVTRWFSAPADLLWLAWTDPQHLTKWFGPRGFSLTTDHLHLKEGGTWKFIMHGPDGTDFPNYVVFTNIVSGKLLEYIHGDDSFENGLDPGMRVSVSFEAERNGTRVTIRTIVKNAEERERLIREYGADEGGLDTMYRLGVVVHELGAPEQRNVVVLMRRDNEIVLRRTLPFAPEKVFAAWVDPATWPHWLAAEHLTLIESSMDLRIGGSFTMVHARANGQKMTMRAEFLDVQEPSLLKAWQYFEMPGIPPIKHLVEITFLPIDLESSTGNVLGTNVTISETFESRSVRDSWYEADRDLGMKEAFEKLEAWLNR